MIDDEYLTIAHPATAEIKVKGSRFIGATFLATSAAEVSAQLEAVQKSEHAATHHCYAYRHGLGPDQIFKYSDDGEPNQTAGKPIYDQLCGRSLTQILIVVTRYFGGTKLGPGGLVRAYSETTAKALDRSGTKTNYITVSFDLTLDFTHYDRWLKALTSFGANVTRADFAEKVSQQVSIRKSLAEKLQATFVELTSGQGEIHPA